MRFDRDELAEMGFFVHKECACPLVATALKTDVYKAPLSIDIDQEGDVFLNGHRLPEVNDMKALRVLLMLLDYRKNVKGFLQ